MITVISAVWIVFGSLLLYFAALLILMRFAPGGSDALERELSTIRRNISDAKRAKGTNILWTSRDVLHISVLTAQLRSEGYSVTHLSGNDIRISWVTK